MRRILGFSGAAGSGKDTLAKSVTDHFPYWVSYSLASPIKGMLTTLLEHCDWDDREWKEANVEGLGVSPRFLAQTLGTEWGRTAVGNDFWLSIADRYIASLPEYVEGVVIPDVRFENEADWIHRHGGWLIRVDRPDNPIHVDNASHSSEAGIPEHLVDYTVVNREGEIGRAIAECRSTLYFALETHK